MLMSLSLLFTLMMPRHFTLIDYHASAFAFRLRCCVIAMLFIFFAFDGAAPLSAASSYYFSLHCCHIALYAATLIRHFHDFRHADILMRCFRCFILLHFDDCFTLIFSLFRFRYASCRHAALMLRCLRHAFADISMIFADDKRHAISPPFRCHICYCHDIFAIAFIDAIFLSPHLRSIGFFSPRHCCADDAFSSIFMPLFALIFICHAAVY